jgi:hypothetical protein
MAVMETVRQNHSSPGYQRWFDLLDCLRECAADHVRLAATDALIAVEHDWMVSSFVNQSEFTAQALSTLSMARGDIVDEIEARVRTRFEVMGLANAAYPPSMQNEMERLRLAKPAAAVIASILQSHGDHIAGFGKRFSEVSRPHVMVELNNPLDPTFLIEQVLETLAGLTLPFNMREALLNAFAREWTRELRGVLNDSASHFVRFQEHIALDQAAENDPQLHNPQSHGHEPAWKNSSTPGKVAISTIQSGYEHFNWSTSLGAGDVLDGPQLRPSLLDPSAYRPPAVEEPAGRSHSASILPFRRAVTRAEASSILTPLQKQPPLRIRSAFDGAPHELSQRIKNQLVTELRAVQPYNLAPLSPHDEQAAGSVGDMFQQAVGKDENLQDRAKGALSRMVVPCLKAAVIDRGPFEGQDHPARKLISSLAEAIRDSKGESMDRSALMDRAEEAVDRVVAEYNEDMAILTIVEQELRGFMQQWEMATEGGKQVVGAIQPRQTSEINATHALLERTAGVTLPYAVAEFMTGPWHRRLVRFGMSGLSGGPEWCATLELADHLLALWSVHPPTRRDAVATINTLAPQIDAIWLDDGAPAERSQVHRNQLMVALDDILRPEDIDVHERQVAKMEEEMASKPATDSDRDFVKLLRVGDWIMLTGPDGTTRQAKLSWISPISDRRLFVSRQGVRIMVATADELAALKRIGRLRME